MNLLNNYGLTDRYISEATIYENLTLGRVVAQYRGLYKVVTDNGELIAEISGKLRYNTDELAKYPAVGDFVMLKSSGEADRAIIQYILTRRSAFLRKAVGVSGQAQVIAANIDVVFICMSLNNNYNLSRLERYLSVTWDSGATPVIILTKSDLCENVKDAVSEVERVSCFSDVIALSMYDNILEKLEKYLQKGVTTAFIGSSGVGKSTLINNILGENVIATNEINRDDKGRHTTTGREMFICPTGGVVIDTPGIRELGAESVDLSKSFIDIEELASRCRYGNCTHMTEPGCAVRKAIEDGLIDDRRLENYFKLKTEAGYDGLNSKQRESKKLERMFRDVGGMKNVRKFVRENDKRNKK